MLGIGKKRREKERERKGGGERKKKKEEGEMLERQWIAKIRVNIRTSLLHHFKGV